jgi:hypothetical protein
MVLVHVVQIVLLTYQLVSADISSKKVALHFCGETGICPFRGGV